VVGNTGSNPVAKMSKPERIIMNMLQKRIAQLKDSVRILEQHFQKRADLITNPLPAYNEDLIRHWNTLIESRSTIIRNILFLLERS